MVLRTQTTQRHVGRDPSHASYQRFSPLPKHLVQLVLDGLVPRFVRSSSSSSSSSSLHANHANFLARRAIPSSPPPISNKLLVSYSTGCRPVNIHRGGYRWHVNPQQVHRHALTTLDKMTRVCRPRLAEFSFPPPPPPSLPSSSHSLVSRDAEN